MASSPTRYAFEEPCVVDLVAQHRELRAVGALLRASLRMGALYSGASEAGYAALSCYGEHVGLAFQIVDDILDIEGDAASIGKTPGKDAAAGKPTYPALYGIAESRRMASDCLGRAEAALAGAGLADSWLLGIGRWIVNRSN